MTSCIHYSNRQVINSYYRIMSKFNYCSIIVIHTSTIGTDNADNADKCVDILILYSVCQTYYVCCNINTRTGECTIIREEIECYLTC